MPFATHAKSYASNDNAQLLTNQKFDMREPPEGNTTIMGQLAFPGELAIPCAEIHAQHVGMCPGNAGEPASELPTMRAIIN